MNSSSSTTSHNGGSAGTWKVLALLTVTNLLMSLDRTIPQIVSEPVKREFNLSDTQLGIFIGVAFGLSYGVSGLILGPLVDRYNRSRLLATILAVWSSMTFLTGLAGSYLALVVTRMGLGAAEAGGNPAALSIISDLYPAEKRSSAIGIYKVGVPLGIFLASVLAGVLATHYGWRTVFFVAGIPGIVLALFIWFGINEPRRGAFEGTGDGKDYKAVPYRTAIRFILFDRVVMPLTVGMFISVFAGAAIYAFAASFLQRFHAMPLDQVGIYVGIGSAMSAISPVLIGFYADRIIRSGAKPLLFFLAAINGLAAVAAVVMLTQQPVWLAIAGLLIWQFLSMALTTPGMAALITMTPIGMRGTVIACISVGNILIGFGLGPFVVGMVSDSIGTENSLKAAMIIVSSVGYIISTACFLLSGRQVISD